MSSRAESDEQTDVIHRIAQARSTPGLAKRDELVEPDESADGRRRGVTLLWAYVVPTLLVLLAVGLIAIFVLGRGAGADDRAGREAREAARDGAVTLLSYTADNVLTGLEAKTEILSGDFADEYRNLVSGTIAPSAQEGGVTAEATVTGDALVSAEDDAAEVLLFLNVSVDSDQLEAPRVSGSRVVVSLENVDDQWRITDLQPV